MASSEVAAEITDEVSNEVTNPASKPDPDLDMSTEPEEQLKGTGNTESTDPVPDENKTPPPTGENKTPPTGEDKTIPIDENKTIPTGENKTIPTETQDTEVGDPQVAEKSSEGDEVASKKQKTDTIPPSIPEVLYKAEWTPKCGREAVVDRIRGCLYGNALGDAMGLATEFMVKADVKRYYKKSGAIPFKDIVPDFHRMRWTQGDWTDDTDQMLLILEGIVESGGKVEALNFAEKLRNWAWKGFPDLGDKGGLGIGMTVHTTIVNSSFLSDPHAAARQVWEDSGKYLAANGAVMRTSVLGIPCFNQIETVVRNTLEISKTTHADPRCSASCVAVTTLISQLLQSSYPCSKGEIENILKKSIEEGSKQLEDPNQIDEFTLHMNASSFQKLNLDEAKKIGYTLKCAGSAFVGLRSKVSDAKDFLKVMTELVREAGDADTNGAVCGAVMGCKIGYKKLPLDWIALMPHLKWFDKKVEQFLTCLGLGGEEVTAVGAV